jgi:hypothetical protein
VSGFRHHERHPVTGTCVWCHVNSTSSVGCTRGPNEVERLTEESAALRSQIRDLEVELSQEKAEVARLMRELSATGRHGKCGHEDGPYKCALPVGHEGHCRDAGGMGDLSSRT